MGKKAVRQVTKVIYENKVGDFCVTKVIDPLHLYFINNQDQIVLNLAQFGINPNKGSEQETGVTLTKIGSNVIITLSVVLIGKEVLMQFLIKSGFTLDRFTEICKEKKLERFEPFYNIIRMAIPLTGGLTEEDMVLKNTIECNLNPMPNVSKELNKK